MDFQNIKAMNSRELTELIDYYKENSTDELFAAADLARRKYYGKKVFFRGLIEFSSYCKNDCFYCGIRHSNPKAVRYRLSQEEILECCKKGHDLGFRTFVLQSGEDLYYTDDILCKTISDIKRQFPDSAITLSIGEKSKETYKRYFEAGADRYLLRHETAENEHYKKLHPGTLSLANRKQCLLNLKEIGFQVGAGFMVGSPYQTTKNLASDLIFLRELQPQMIGIGPFIPHCDTIFANEEAGSVKLTLIMISLVRLTLEDALIPSTTALGTADPKGREKGLMAGANVVMPNLSPVKHRRDYSLYDNKICTGEEAAECLLCLSKRIESAGYEPDFSRGDHCAVHL